MSPHLGQVVRCQPLLSLHAKQDAHLTAQDRTQRLKLHLPTVCSSNRMIARELFTQILCTCKHTVRRC